MAESTIKKSDHVHLGTPTTFNFGTSWTAPSDGFLQITVTKTSGDGALTWYIKDKTANIGALGAVAIRSVTSGYSNSILIPVLKNHVYEQEYTENVNKKYARFYPIAY